jgi:hypothetical protein
MTTDADRHVQRWWALDGAVHREVARLAADGRRHPDPHVAALADAWAATVSPVPTSIARRIAGGLWDALRVAVDIVASTSTGPGTFGICDVASERGQRGLARQIRELTKTE